MCAPRNKEKHSVVFQINQEKGNTFFKCSCAAFFLWVAVKKWKNTTNCLWQQLHSDSQPSGLYTSHNRYAISLAKKYLPALQPSLFKSQRLFCLPGSEFDIYINSLSVLELERKVSHLYLICVRAKCNFSLWQCMVVKLSWLLREICFVWQAFLTSNVRCLPHTPTPLSSHPFN